MFDPTAFENIKVVIEGAIYDRDLSGEILVIDRNDWINTAKLSRKYEITCCLPGDEHSGVNATMTLEAGLENLSAELMDMKHAAHLAGCKVVIHFSLIHRNESSLYKRIHTVLEEIWGSGRVIEQIVQIHALEDSSLVKNKASISFNRLIYENQIDDLTEMIGYMIQSLVKLKASLS
ncbi:hypothetical protein V7201_04635 [Bacillus sp. JJ1122]|uniref:hypothetical protein n=1 Tax=Bacillus sp. JJ1122 TaxID=3122951 RepID=UPI002FFE9529